MAHFASSHCIYLDELVSVCLDTVLNEDPELVYSSLVFLKACAIKEKNMNRIHLFLIDTFSKLNYGKIIKKVFDILNENINMSNFEHLLDVLLIDLNSSDDKIPFYLTNEPDVYIGEYICMCISIMYDKTWNSKTRTLGVLLRFIEQGTSKSIMDQSSKSTITTCVRAVLEEKTGVFNENILPVEYSSVDVLKPIEFSMIKTSTIFKKFLWEDPLNAKQLTIQMSGLGDPLYIEANVTYSKYEMLLDLLVINQTSSYLQEISLDFSYSKNLQMISKIDVFSLQPNSACTIKAQLSILESLTSFITATATFKYPKKDDYSGKPFVQNLDEIKMNINEFLEGASIKFQDQWKNLEWENIYSNYHS